ncbi:MAG: hypothetical protein ACJ763_10065 [Bdellovibrionia bacterium]
MKSYSTMLAGVAALALGILSFQHIAHSQTSGSNNQSDYIFRFNSGISSVFLSSATFPQQQPIDLGSCTATEQINGPLICAMNCSNVPVCLLNVSGPPGASVTDVLEKVSEVSITAGQSASPTPSASSQPAAGTFGNMIFRGSVTHEDNLSKRIEIYNSVH